MCSAFRDRVVGTHDREGVDMKTVGELLRSVREDDVVECILASDVRKQRHPDEYCRALRELTALPVGYTARRCLFEFRTAYQASPDAPKALHVFGCHAGDRFWLNMHPWDDVVSMPVIHSDGTDKVSACRLAALLVEQLTQYVVSTIEVSSYVSAFEARVIENLREKFGARVKVVRDGGPTVN
jgi:hypothetical protein